MYRWRRWRSRGRGWRGWGSALLAATLFALVSCSSGGDPTVDLTKAEPSLERVIQRKWFPSLEVGAVTCPTKQIARSKGKTSSCTVLVEGEPVEFKVVQTNSQGGVAPQRYEAILSTQEAELAVGERYNVSNISCGDSPYFVLEPGTQFRCDVTGSNGRQAEVIIEVVDPRGNIKFIGNT